ncbi:S8 family serine peptidase [Brevibacillus sp. SYP-B805]|uniref:S8 family peptidase n=1 Tax=Brevibacillus sp. SYP-B805 TaxID=1578199 RepID=UPI0013EA3524|nr:S8 family serine peptidase [Brevibacillus sp. SYP-B805]NGQ95616.1 S8 family serine peptidase [Brevibacillus sp. SYP-B805]
MNARRLIRGLLVVAILCPLVPGAVQETQAAAITNDRYINNQTHLKQIKADKAWATVTGNTAITIAQLDSGVDTDHPDLKGNLLPGINLVNPGRPAEDDNGHGTSTAGILAARGNNGIGVSGVLWNARILPIKVLDSRGEQNNVDVIASGINTAINRGAKIVVMSVSSITTSRALEEAVKRAEAKGVILVAATGNEGSRVDYPAAYPTVIAVGAVDSNNEPWYRSNYGPEIKIMAPGKSIYTTKMGGSYGAITGTSAAAPQVAAACALILAKYPKMTPLEVRQLLYQTARDLNVPGWDRRTGYGLLDINKALHTTPKTDFLEPNSSQSSAKAFPIEGQLRADLNQNDRIDWYYMDIPYDGKVTFNANVTTRSIVAIAATFYVANEQPHTYYIGNGDTLTIPAKEGRMYLKLERSGGIGSFNYVLTSHFNINPDRYERNNDMATARPLVGNQIALVGNFHEPNDKDWFSYYVREYGLLNITVTTDTNRLDTVLYIGKQGQGWDLPYDNSTRDDQTERVTKEVSPGKYYIRLSEYYNSQVNGEYFLNLKYTPERKDTNEPNDSYRQASPLANGVLMTGTLPTVYDYDWFRFDVDADSYVSIRAPYIPVSSGVRLALYGSNTFNYALASENMVAELSDRGKTITGLRLRPGRYYVRLNSTVPIRYDTYRLTLTKERLIEGYRDIATHWARSEIARLTRKGVVKGFNDATFRPNQAVTRAEFAVMLLKAMRASGAYVSPYTGSNPFRDISKKHWAYDDLMKAYRLGIIRGYPNNTIKPNQPLTRAEMAVMVARAQNALLYKHSYSSYRDVSNNYWASPAIEALTSRGWIQGYDGGVFKPLAYARRAEMVVLLTRIYKL